MTAAWGCYAVCVCVCVEGEYGSSEGRLHKLDPPTLLHMHTSDDSKKKNLRKDYFLGCFIFCCQAICHHYSRFNSCLSLLYYCRLSVFLPRPHLSKAMKKSQPSLGYCNKSNIPTIGVTNWVIRWSHQVFFPASHFCRFPALFSFAGVWIICRRTVRSS